MSALGPQDRGVENEHRQKRTHGYDLLGVAMATPGGSRFTPVWVLVNAPPGKDRTARSAAPLGGRLQGERAFRDLRTALMSSV